MLSQLRPAMAAVASTVVLLTGCAGSTTIAGPADDATDTSATTATEDTTTGSSDGGGSEVDVRGDAALQRGAVEAGDLRHAARRVGLRARADQRRALPPAEDLFKIAVRPLPGLVDFPLDELGQEPGQPLVGLVGHLPEFLLHIFRQVKV